MSTALVLFRRDLRLADHPAWSAACAGHTLVLPVFIHADGDDAWPAGAASGWWRHHSLAALDHDLHDAGAGLRLRRGEALGTLRDWSCKAAPARCTGTA